MTVDQRTEQAAIAAQFLERLISLMDRQGLDPEKGEHLAHFVGVSKSTGYNWITPGKTPSARALKKIAEAFGSSADYLLGITDDPGPCRSATAEEVAARGARAARKGAG